jgi:hypothetical protein
MIRLSCDGKADGVEWLGAWRIFCGLGTVCRFIPGTNWDSGSAAPSDVWDHEKGSSAASERARLETVRFRPCLEADIDCREELFSEELAVMWCS